MIIGSTRVKELGDSLAWCAGLEVDVDGAPNAYCPLSLKPQNPLDDIRNAGEPGNWYALACNSYGIPYVQGVADPYPGYYVSTSALVDHSKPVQDPKRYVPAHEIPYTVIPPELTKIGARLGALCMILYNDTLVPAIVGDIGPRKKVGEGSFALHKMLGVDPQRAKPKHKLVGIASGVYCVLFFGSGSTPAWPRSLDSIANGAIDYFNKWGGVDRLRAVTIP